MSTPALQVRSRIPKIAGAAVERARLTVVPRRRPKTAGRAPFLALVSMVLLGGVVGLLLFNTSMQQASFAATALEQQADRLSARQQGLEMDLDRLRDPQRIAAAATKLGMVQACSPAFLDLGSGEIKGQPCAGNPAAPQVRTTARPPKKPAVLNPPTRQVVVPPTSTDSRAEQNSSSDTGSENRSAPGRDGKKKVDR